MDLEFLAYWGKAQPDAPAPYPDAHPVAYHSLDVAACVGALLDSRPRLLARAASFLRLNELGAVRQVLTTLAALHDIGKFAPAFQVKAPEHWPAALGPCDPPRVVTGRHTDDGYVLWHGGLARRVADRLWPGSGPALRALAPAIFGHHGNPVGGANVPLPEQRFRAALPHALACADALLALLSPEPVRAPAPEPETARLASWWVAGLMTTADWVGSGQRRFRYTAPRHDDPTLAEYWALARDRAREAVRDAGLAAPPPAPVRTLLELTGERWPPSPAQAWAAGVPLSSGPALFVVEDVTGSGKTEAAHMLVHRLIAGGHAAGAYWAMPTQATANAMYGRQAKVFDRLFADGAAPKPSLVLAHGQQKLHDGFRATVLDGAASAGEASGADPADDGPSTATCAAFLADDRRAALLADVGAGTVDQAILGVLNSRFNAVRLFALADRVLVVDEAHAYDAYMSVEVEELLRFQAALGGPAVVLSATLSHRQRDRLARAWADGLRLGGHSPPSADDGPLVSSNAYPLATVVACDGVQEKPVAAAERSRRKVTVRLVHDVDAARNHVLRVAAEGGAAVWVRNTVDDCLDAAEQLRTAGLAHAPLIFHARFAQADRQAREREVMSLFGKDASAEARRGRVLVATQVVEQSLDLDFDAMVSDVAPVDLLIQRAGRLWRHPKPKGSRPPGCRCELVVLSPAPSNDPPADWLGGAFAGTAHVYAHAGMLWRTVQALANVGVIATPDGLRALVERVYRDGSFDDVPETLWRPTSDAIGKEQSAASLATFSTLNAAEGYDASQRAWLSDLRVPTRLGDEQTTVRLARVEGGRLVPWAAADTPWKAWALSEVRVRRTRIPPDAAPAPEFAAAAEAARGTWGRFERELPVLPLVEDGAGTWRGELLRPERRGVIPVCYTTTAGLAFGAAP